MDPLHGQRRGRREVIELQLTAMIDVFSMIVIFLVLGGVFGGADIVLPEKLKAPRSISSELSGTAPTLSIVNGKVHLSLLEKTLPINAFRGEGGPRVLDEYRSKIREYAKSDVAKKQGSIPLNVAADTSVSYRDVFDVIKVMRQLGFEQMLFVAVAERRPK